MIRPTAHQLINSGQFCLMAVLIGLAMEIPAGAGVSVGPAPTNATDAEQRRISLFYEAQKSFQEKVKVGQERYKTMEATRANAVSGMTSALAARQQTVNIPSSSASDSEKIEPHAWTDSLLGAGIIGLIFLGFRYHLSQQDAKDIISRRM